MLFVDCRKDSFITHRAFCDALAEESARMSANSILLMHPTTGAAPSPNAPQMQHSFHLNPSSLFPNAAVQHHQPPQRHFANPPSQMTTTGGIMSGHISLGGPWEPQSQNPNHHPLPMIKTESMSVPPYFQEPPPPQPPMSATALLQKAASIGATVGHVNSSMAQLDRGSTVGHVNMKMAPHDYLGFGTWQKGDPLTRDFLGLTADHGSTTANGGGGGRDHDHHHRLFSYAAAGGGVDELFPSSSSNNNNMYNERDNSLFKHHQLSFGFAAAAAETASETWGNC